MHNDWSKLLALSRKVLEAKIELEEAVRQMEDAREKYECLRMEHEAVESLVLADQVAVVI